MTDNQLKNALELKTRIRKLETLIKESNAMLYLCGVGGDKNDMFMVGDFEGAGKCHDAMRTALNDLLAKYQAEFKQM